MKKQWLLLVLIVLSILPLLDLLHPGLPVTHDGQDHVARIANFYQSLSEGHIVPRWAGNLNWGYGHPILMFLYPLPSYIASLFHLIGFSFVDATKLVFALSYVASIAAMYVWGSSQFGATSGFVAAVLYGFAPYRFVDLYVRGAIGEHVAFIWPPVIFWGLLQLARQRRVGSLAASIGTAGLILSHNAISLMVLPIIVLYGLYLYYFETKKNFRFLLLGSWPVALGFLLSTFFWMPAFLEGKYTLRDIVTKGEFHDRFVPALQFLYSSWNYAGGNEISKSLGIVQWMATLVSVALFWKIKKPAGRWMTGGTLFVLIASLFLMTAASEFIWQRATLLQKFQFPWRLLTVSVMATSITGAIVASTTPKKFRSIIVIFVTVVSGLTTFSMWRAKENSVRAERFYTDVYEGTTDTGESSPIWSVRFMEKKPDAPIALIDGEASIVSLSRSTTLHRYEVTATKPSRIVENTLYFPGWQVFVDGNPTEIQFQDSNYRGLMTFWVGAGKHTVQVRFGETRLRQVANSLSILGVVFFVGGIIPLRKRRR